MYYAQFRDMGISAPYRSSGNVKVQCPKCADRDSKYRRNKNLSIKLDTGQYKCHSSSCEWSSGGSVARKSQKYDRPKFKGRTNLPARIEKYFASRGIGSETLKKMKIEIDDGGNIQFNYFEKGELINYKVRIQQGKGKSFRQHKDAEHILFNVDSLKGKEKAIITEGEMDALSYIEAGLDKEYGIVSIDQGAGAPGSDLGNKLKCLESCAEEVDQIKTWYISMDRDEPGYHTEAELVRRLGAYRCKIVEMPDGCKDANEVLEKLPQDKGARIQTLRNCIENAKQVPVSGIISLDDDLWEKLMDIYDNGEEAARSSGHVNLDKHLRFLKGAPSLWTGYMNHGKGSFTRYMMVVLSVQYGTKWALYVPEDMPEEHVYIAIAECFIGKMSSKDFANRMNKNEYQDGMLFAQNHFHLIDPEPDENGRVALPTNKYINQRISFLRLKYGVTGYMKDPWNCIHHDFAGQREDQYLSATLSEEAIFARDYDFPWYVAHPKNPNANRIKDGQVPVPDVYDIYGGSMWGNKMYNIITCHQPERHNDATDPHFEVHVKKVKKQKLAGRPGTVRFFHKFEHGGRFSEISEFGDDLILGPLEREAEIEEEIADEDMPF